MDAYTKAWRMKEKLILEVTRLERVVVLRKEQWWHVWRLGLLLQSNTSNKNWWAQEGGEYFLYKMVRQFRGFDKAFLQEKPLTSMLALFIIFHVIIEDTYNSFTAL